MSDPADLINVAIEQLIAHRFELPAFQTLDRLVSHVRYGVHQDLYARMTAALSPAEQTRLEALLHVHDGPQRVHPAQGHPTPGHAGPRAAVDGTPHLARRAPRPTALPARHCPHQGAAVCGRGCRPRCGGPPRYP